MKHANDMFVVGSRQQNNSKRTNKCTELSNCCTIISYLSQVISGSYEPKNGQLSQSMRETMTQIAALRAQRPPRSGDFFDCLFAPLAHGGYIRRHSKEFDAGGRTISYDVYTVTDLGRAVLRGGVDSPVVMLPVPASLRELERKQNEKKAQKMKQLTDAGVSMDLIPTKELEALDGPVVRAHLQWLRQLQLYRQRGDNARADAHEVLLKRLEAWRDATAEKLKLAPASVLPDDKARQIAYSKPSHVDALRAIGVRIAGSEMLLEVVSKWRSEFESGGASSSSGNDKRDRDDGGAAAVAGSNTSSMPIAFPSPCRGTRWGLFVHRPKNKWEASVNRFHAGEPHEAIAMKQDARPLAPATIMGHLMQGVEAGMEVDLNRLARECESAGRPAPDVSLWRRLEEACAVSGVDVITTEKLVMKSIVNYLVEHDSEKLAAEKTMAEKALEADMYNALRWYVSITRAQIEVVLPGLDGSSSSQPAKKIREV
jgi:hypothetical protein